MMGWRLETPLELYAISMRMQRSSFASSPTLSDLMPVGTAASGVRSNALCASIASRARWRSAIVDVHIAQLRDQQPQGKISSHGLQLHWPHGDFFCVFSDLSCYPLSAHHIRTGVVAMGQDCTGGRHAHRLSFSPAAFPRLRSIDPACRHRQPAAPFARLAHRTGA